MMKEGDKVVCTNGNIASGAGKGEIGYVTGFARLSPYHPREVWVSHVPQYDGTKQPSWCGWFWERDVKQAG